MTNRKPSVDLGYPTPARGRIPSFQNIEEEAAFWDTHDTAEFSSEFTEVDVDVSQNLEEKLTLRLDRADKEALARYARKKGIGPSTLVRMWIREHLEREKAR